MAPARDVGVEVGGRLDDREPPIRARGHVVGTVGEVDGAFGEAAPRAGRPAGGQGEQQHVVAAVVVALEVEVARRLRGGGQDLERDVALDQPGDVDVAALAALQEVAAPEERIGVEVGHEERLVELPGAFRSGIGSGPVDPAEAALRSRDEGGAHRSSQGQPGRSSPGRRGAEGRQNGSPLHPTRHRVGVILMTTG